MKKRKFLRVNSELIELRKDNKRLRDEVEKWKNQWFSEAKTRRRIENELRSLAGNKIMGRGPVLMTMPYFIG